MPSTVRSTLFSALALSAGLCAWGPQALAAGGGSMVFPYRAQAPGQASSTGCVVPGVGETRSDVRPWVQVTRY